MSAAENVYRFAARQELSIDLPGLVVEYLKQPTPQRTQAMAYLEGLTAFLHNGELHLLDGGLRKFYAPPRGVWTVAGSRERAPQLALPEGPRAKGDYRLTGVENGNLVFLWDDGQRPEQLTRDSTGKWIAASSSPESVLKTPVKGGIDWVKAGQGRSNVSRLEGALPRAVGAVPVLFADYDPSPYGMRSILQGSDLIALVCDQGKARALWWQLAHSLPGGLEPPAGNFFTGQQQQVVFAQSQDGSVVLHADKLGLGSEFGTGSSAFRLRLGSTVCRLSLDPERSGRGAEQNATVFCATALNRYLPLPLTVQDGVAKWKRSSHTPGGYADSYEEFEFRLNLASAQGHLRIHQWTDH